MYVLLILNVLNNDCTMPCSSLASRSHDFSYYPPRVLGSVIKSTKLPLSTVMAQAHSIMHASISDLVSCAFSTILKEFYHLLI